jgi:hypothetical protein
MNGVIADIKIRKTRILKGVSGSKEGIKKVGRLL